MKKLISLLLVILMAFSSCLLTNNILAEEIDSTSIDDETVEVYDESEDDIEVIDDTSNDEDIDKEDDEIIDDFIDEIPEDNNQDNDEIQNTGSTEGKEYYVVLDSYDLLFFRSFEEYRYNTNGTFYDTQGRAYTGTIFTISESTLCPTLSKYIKTVDIVDGYTIKPTSMGFWFCDMENLTSIDFTGLDTSKVTHMSYLFYNCKSLTSLDLSNFDTSNVYNMPSMFGNCTSLTSLDLSNFDTSKVNMYGMNGMFSGCSSLKTLNLSSFNTSRIYGMEDMFYGCSSLESLDLSSFDTSNMNNMDYAFESCSSLKTLVIRSFDTSKVVRMEKMFYGCSSLESLDLSNFNTEKVSNMKNMFANCTSLKTLNFSNFDTSKVTDMGYMFSGCSSLKSINLSHFDTSKVTNMGYMFSGCSSLTSLNLNSFDTSKVEDMIEMFSGCTSLTTLNLSTFNTSRMPLYYFRDMFLNCVHLSRVCFGPQWTKWSNKAYLPVGIWTHGSISKTETELYEEYPSHSEEWAGWWYKEVYFENFESGFKLGRDNNSYEHSRGKVFDNNPFYFDNNFLWAITELNSEGRTSFLNKILYKDNKDQQVCHGITMTMALIYNNKYRISDISDSDAEVYYDLNPLEDKKLQNYIMYYFLSQWFSSPYDFYILKDANDGVFYDKDKAFEEKNDNYSNYYTDLSDALRALVNYLSQEQKVCVFGYGWGDGHYDDLDQDVYLNAGGHSILATGIMYNEKKKKYEIELYDLNIMKYGKMIIESDFSGYDFEDISIPRTKKLFKPNANENIDLRWFRLISYEHIDELVNDTEKALKRQEIVDKILEDMNTSISVSKDSEFSIAFDDNSSLMYSHGNVSGNVNVVSRRPFMDNSDTTSISYELIEVDNYNSFLITPLSENIDITVHNEDSLLSIEGIGIEQVSLSFDNGIVIEGDDYEFESFITKGIYSGDELVMNSISGSSSGTTNIYEQNGKVYATNNNGIIPKESSTFIGVNRFTKEYSSDDAYTHIVLDDHQYSQNEYLVTFISDLEEYQIDKRYLTKGSYISRPSDPNVEGVIFNGWYTSGVFQNEDTLWDFNNDTIDSNVVLYASYDLIKAQDISLDKNNISMYLGETKTLVHTLQPNNTYVKDVEWISSDEDILTVDQDGNLIPVSEGVAIVTVKTTDGTGLSANCTVTVIDPYGDIIEEDRPINPEDIPNGLWYSSTPESDELYTGKAIKKTFRVYEHKKLLKEKTDYTVSYKNNTNAGKATITIAGKGNYTKTDTIEFNILPKDITDLDVVINEIATVKENGKIQKLKPIIKCNGKALNVNKDFTVEYNDNYDDRTAYQDPGLYNIVIKGMGNYIGEIPMEYEIAATDQVLVSKLSLTKPKDVVYDGTSKEVDVVLKNGKQILVKDQDYTLSYSDDNVNIGTVTVTITGVGKYSGKRTTSFKITGTSLSKAKLNNFKSSLDYNDGLGVVQSESFTLTDKNKNTVSLNGIAKNEYDLLLDEDKKLYDYTFEYTNNINPGKATVIYTGVNAYTGIVKKTYTIAGIALSKAKINNFITSYIYDGTNRFQDLNLTYQKDKNSDVYELVEGKDYELSYLNTNKAGSATVSIIGKGKFTGTIKKTYKITPYDLGKDTDNLISIICDNSAPYSKAGAKADVKVYYGRKLLKPGSDYTLSYTNNKALNDGSNPKKMPTVTIKGKGNFTGTDKTTTFNIVKADISNVKMMAIDKVYSLKKGAWKSAVTVTDNGKKLSAGSDYDKNVVYTYVNDTQIENGYRSAGDVVQDSDIIPALTEIRVTVTGINNYYGQNSYVYHIAKADINKCNITVDVKEYTGKPVTLTKDDITVKLGGQMVNPDNYEIDETTYTNNIKKGKATVELKGINDLGSTKKISFTIGPKSFLWWWRNLTQ